jgi:hypothetical protein
MNSLCYVELGIQPFFMWLQIVVISSVISWRTAVLPAITIFTTNKNEAWQWNSLLKNNGTVASWLFWCYYYFSFGGNSVSWFRAVQNYSLLFSILWITPFLQRTYLINIEFQIPLHYVWGVCYLKFNATTLYPQKLALTSRTSCGRSVGIVRSRTKATELVGWYHYIPLCKPDFSIDWPCHSSGG